MPQPPARILVVEDSEVAAGALRLLLESAGYTVRVAASVAGALGVATSERPDALIMDMTLPDGDGTDILARLGPDPAPAIALTGHDDDEVRTRCLAAGCSAVLVKPAPAAELLATLRSL